MAFVVWIIATTTAQAQCIAQTVQVAAVEEAVLDERDNDARTELGGLVESFGCGPLASPANRARRWRAQAVLFDRSGEIQAANEAFLAAAELSP
ncbi:MAG: hypothetical protein AAF602_17390, partial [Myxococcota bacterium]